MKSRKAVRAIASILLCGLGVWLALPNPYREKTYLIDAGGCRLETTVVEKQGGGSQGTVVLFHGISANKKIMSYVARGFAEQNLRVYVSDLPGHGHTPGPFSPERAEECGEALLRLLLASGMANPDRTILAGHSMGGAIALRIASRVAVAGVMAISPAPMHAAHGVSAEKLFFHDVPALTVPTLVISGSLEPESMHGNAADLVRMGGDGTAKYLEIPGQTHVSLIFSSTVIRTAQEWCAQILYLPSFGALPSHRPLLGALAGVVGLLLLAGPFLRELIGKKEEGAETESAPALGRALAEIAIGSILAVVILQFWNPLRRIHLFQGDYLAGFLLLLAVPLVVLHWSSIRSHFSGRLLGLLAAAFGAIMLLLLFTGWLDLSFYEAWLTAAKWLRIPFLLIALLPYHLAEEALLGPVQTGKRWRRLALALSFRLISWAALLGGIFFLHSGQILMGLLAPYMALCNLIQRSGMDIVREKTGSAAATAVFGAILLAGFCLVIFPIT
ncbi:MAG TPA: alpha/beta fold hydrolase [Candidatus Acidoferrum sp.]|jgi:dienelactone hydrolase|nr:alpha/beta fold hydrolase [Candidatus Acidoferrum sp.]